ncbi:MAG TPA: PEGA domain-containing protein [Kofleriaceae bacterium]|jgi:hypothetical protein
MSSVRARALWSMRALACSMLISACGKPAQDPPPPTEPVPAAPADAAVDGISQIGSYDPASGAHLDDDGPAVPTAKPGKRTGKPIEIMLRSTPSGARAYVDGNFVGVTPTYWPGDTGAEHEFTFAMPQYELARYRFVPVQTGVLHARLELVIGDVAAGMPPAHLVEPPPLSVVPETPPLAPVTPPPPPTVINPSAAPVDAAPSTGYTAPPGAKPWELPSGTPSTTLSPSPPLGDAGAP